MQCKACGAKPHDVWMGNGHMCNLSGTPMLQRDGSTEPCIITDLGLHLWLQLQGIVATDEIWQACLERMPHLRLLLKPCESMVYWPKESKLARQQLPKEATGVAPVRLCNLLCLQTTEPWLLQRLQAPQLSFLHVLHWPFQVCGFPYKNLFTMPHGLWRPASMLACFKDVF